MSEEIKKEAQDTELNPEDLDKVTGGSGNDSANYYVGTDWYRWEDGSDYLRYFYDQSGNLLGVASFEFLEENYDKYGDWGLPDNDPNEWKLYYDVLDK